MPFTSFTYGDPAAVNNYPRNPAISLVAVSLVSGLISAATSPVPVAQQLQGGTLGSAYSETLTSNGGTAPYSWTATGLPPGLSIDSSTGAISGTPTTAGTYSPSVTVTDAISNSQTQTFQIVVSSATTSPVANYGFIS